MTPARRRVVAFAELAVIAGALLLAWSQPWLTASIDGASAAIGGDRVAAGLVAIALAVLALIAALALAGPVLRSVLGVLASLLGVASGAIALIGLMDPQRALETTVAERTGLTGEGAVAALVSDVAATPWGPVAVGISGLLLLVGIQLAVTAARWPSSARRYSRTRLTPEGGTAIDDWDALTAGDDPTSTD